MVKEYEGRAGFVCVYIREAHPADSPRARESWSKVNDPKDHAERMKVAKRCMDELDLGVPFVVDTMADETAKAWDGYPDRLFVVGTDRKIAYRGGRGPRGFKPEEMAESLAKLLKK